MELSLYYYLYLKDEDNTVSISLTYQDEISFFGFILKKLEFTMNVTERETKEYF